MVQPPLSRNLRHALAERAMTQEACARELGVTLRTVSSWCLGDALPRWQQLVRVAELLGREPGWFYTDHAEIAA